MRRYHSWDEVSLGMYLEIEGIESDVELVSYMYGIGVEEVRGMSIDRYGRLLDGLRWMSEVPKLSDVDVELRVSDLLDVSMGDDMLEVVYPGGYEGVGCIEGLSRIRSYERVFKELYVSYPRIFGGSSKGDSFTGRYGVLHLIMQVVESVNESFDEVLGWNVYKFLNMVSYLIDRNVWMESQRQV